MYKSSFQSYGGGARNGSGGNSRYGPPSSNGFGGSSNYGGGARKNNNQNEEIILKRPVWNSSTMKPFDKDFYRETQQNRNRSPEDFTIFMKKNSVTVNGESRFRPVLDFNDVSIPDMIMRQIQMAKYDKPTPIQSLCWPTLMSGFNFVGIAQTGSGKTLGFMLPILIHIQNNSRYMRSAENRDEPNGPIALVLAPTRELAQQIQQVAEDFGNSAGVRNIVVYGGASKGPQIQQIRRGAEICIATPGRLLDLLRDNLITLNKCTFLVLDEADRMLDMGFEPQIRKVIEQIRPDRQLAMFSATWPKEVRKLAEDFLSRYVHITIGASELMANPNIKQIVEVCEERDKENKVKSILSEIMSQRDSKAIIFAETKRRVDSFSSLIRSMGYFCLAIHGDKKQNEREWVLNEFKKKPRAILIATDVAARGINIEDIKYVVNIDYPNNTEDYVHRIGRTARNSNTGTSYTLITQENARHLPKLMEILRETNQFVNEGVLNMYKSCGRFGNNGRFNSKGGGNKRFDNNSYGGSSYGSSSYGAQKRSYKDSQDFQTNGTANGYDSRRNDDANGRVKKFRWDSAPDSGTNGSSSSSYTNGMSNSAHQNSYGPPQPPSKSSYGPPTTSLAKNSYGPPSSSSSSSSSAPKSAYGPTSYSAYGAPPPPPPSSSSTSSNSDIKSIPLPPTSAPSAADYSQMYNLQYYQALAASAAANGGWQPAATY